MTQTWIYDGQSIKKVSLSGNEGWNIHGGPPTGDQKEIQDYYIRVPFLNRAVAIRANAVSSLPFAIVNDSGVEIDTSDDYKNKVGFLPNPQRLLSLVESSLFIAAEAYLYQLRNRVKVLNLQYFQPSTIEPQLDERLGVTGFRRRLSTMTLDLKAEDVIHFWQLDPYVELGPGNNSAAMASLSAAGVLYNVDEFASSFFKRGAIKVTLLTTKGPVPEQERNRLKAWWSKLFRGTESAWNSEIIQADAVEPVVLGEGVGELSDAQLVKEKREDISTAAGIPMTMLWSTEAGGLGGGGVVESDERKFYEQTVVPQARFIQGILNEQLFESMGLRWVFRPETLDVFQEDEGKRATALTQYVSAGYPLGLASQILGVELPEGVEYADLDRMKEEKQQRDIELQRAQFGANPQNPQQNPQQANMRADLERWERKALSKGPDAPFESEHIPPALMDSIRASIKELGVEAAFEFLKKKS